MGALVGRLGWHNLDAVGARGSSRGQATTSFTVPAHALLAQVAGAAAFTRGGRVNQVQRVHRRLQREIDCWVNHAELTRASGCKNIHTAIATVRREHQVMIRACQPPNDADSQYMLHSSEGYRQWLAEGQPLVQGETRQRKPGVKPGVAMVCRVLTRMLSGVTPDEAATVVRLAAPDAAITFAKGQFIPATPGSNSSP